MSGSGKSTAISAFEDAGYYCIDNLPTALLPRFMELCVETGVGMARVALGIDLRNEAYVATWTAAKRELEAAGHSVFVLFIDADDHVLTQRFSETRRLHPLGHGGALADALAEERQALAPIREAADLAIDSSSLNVHDLRRRVREEVVEDRQVPHGPRVTIKSFGFKYGIAADADLVFDVRFLPNPYFVKDMQAKTGLDPTVADYVLERELCAEFLGRLSSMVAFLLPCYAEEGKAYLTIALGCTGGRHRSVAVAEELAGRLRDSGVAVIVRHRDIDRATP